MVKSNVEAKFRAITQGICELMWLRRFLEELRIKCGGPMKLFSDTKSAISIANTPVQHDKTKHIEVDRHFIKEKLEEGVICMSFISTKLQLADILTKGLHGQQFEFIIGKLGMLDIFKPA